jgi:hypothetical protein
VEGRGAGAYLIGPDTQRRITRGELAEQLKILAQAYVNGGASC